MGSRLDKNSEAVSKRIQQHDFENEEGDEYGASKFGGFPEYFRRKKIKLQNLDAELRAQSADKPKVFRGIVVHVNGYTQPSLNDLHTLIVSHGGGFMQYLDGKTTVTHIVASSLTPKKAVEFRKYRIVKPAWIVDSVNAGKLLPWHSYRVVDEGAGQKVLGFDDGKIVSQANVKQKGYKDQTDASWYTSQLRQQGDPRNTQLPTPGASSPFADDEQPDGKGPLEGDVPGTRENLQHDDEGPRRSTGDVTDELTSSLRQQLEDFEDADQEDGGVALDITNHTKEVFSGSKDAERQATGATEMQFPEQSETPDRDVPEDERPQLEDALESNNGRKRKLDSPALSPSKKAKLTAEEHNAILLSDPRIRKSSVLNPEFLEQYYRESRLHHLSTWKADLKAQLQAQTAEQTSTQKAQQKRAPGARRYILHVDFDSFFVAVSLKNLPEYVDKPACVAHGPGANSEIASCNYPARKFGVKNGMWMKRAQEVCKELKVLPYDFPAYEAASRLFYEAIMATGGIVQSVSIDEALVDITAFCLPAGGTDGTSVREGSIWREQEKANEIAQGLRDHVKEETGCAVSVGVGTNILLAKLALRKAKPAGQYQIKPEEVLDFIGNLEVQDLPGVAYSIGGKLEEIGVKFVKDIRELTKEKIVNTLGPKTGDKLWNYSRGIDKTEVGDQVIRKSISAEVNWGVRFETQEQAEEFIESLCGELNRRLLKERVKGKQLTMKVMRRAVDAPLDPPKHLGHGKCDTYNKSVALGVATNDTQILLREVMSIFRAWNFSPGELRGLGVQMTKLEPLKPSLGGDIASSQRRLQFKTAPFTEPLKPDGDGSGGHIQSEQHQQLPPPEAPEQNEPIASQRRLQFKQPPQRQLPPERTDDPIRDAPETPQKPKAHQRFSKQSSVIPHIDSPGRKPLNTLGTQFVLPTQVDPQVLAELPSDIRSKLAKHIRTPAQPPQQPGDGHGRAASPAAEPKPFQGTILPSHSQLDPSILDALPEDVRAEIIQHYSATPSRRRKGEQSLLPQSPRKHPPHPYAKPMPVPRGRGRPKGSTNLLSRLRAVRSNGGSTLTQSNFVAGAEGAQRAGDGRAGDHDNTTDSDGGAAGAAAQLKGMDISPEFLEALPEDIRREVMAQHRAEQLKKNSGLELGRRKRAGAGSRRPNTGNDDGTGQQKIAQVVVDAEGNRERVLVLEPRPVKPSFTIRRLSDVGALREAVSLWVEEFADEGPYEEDVGALGTYLGDVIGEEGNMGKAVEVVKWLEWLVERDRPEEVVEEVAGAAHQWTKALDRIRDVVRQAVEARGLGAVDL